MLSVLSRLTKPNDGKKLNMPSPMSTSLQKKFSKGVDYNMKILIKGDRNVGKSCLLQRLQGGSFIEEYHPTDQIQVAPIHWKYKDTEYIIKVEVWEVVDKGRVKKKNISGLKFDNSSLNPSIDNIDIPPLDATFLDVYMNANGVIMMMDITKAWTFEYVKREVMLVPSDIPIIILGNHCDMHHHREITSYQVESFINTTKPTRNGPLRYAETSMRNGFGLRLLHKFLNIPFLQLQRTTLLNQLNVNSQEMNDAFNELDEFERSEVTDYESFLEKLSSKRKQEIGAHLSNVPKIASDKSPSIVLGAGKPIIPSTVNPLTHMNTGILNKSFQLSNAQSSNDINFNNKIKQDNEKKYIPEKVNILKTKDDIDNFCPGILDRSFLDDSPTGISQNNTNAHNIDSDSGGEDGINPLVVSIQDDLDSADENDKIIPIQNSLNKINIHSPSNDIKSLDFENSNIKHYNIENKVQSENFEKLDQSILKNDYYLYNPNETNVENYNYDSGYELNQAIGYDSSPTWPLDTSKRRSPEGGEGIPSSLEIKNEIKVKEEKKHKKSKKSSKDKEKEMNGIKEKDTDKNKDKKHKEKRHKKKNSNDCLEEFLNGPNNQDAYEII